MALAEFVPDGIAKKTKTHQRRVVPSSQGRVELQCLLSCLPLLNVYHFIFLMLRLLMPPSLAWKPRFFSFKQQNGVFQLCKVPSDPLSINWNFWRIFLYGLTRYWVLDHSTKKANSVGLPNHLSQLLIAYIHPVGSVSSKVPQLTHIAIRISLSQYM